MTTTVLDVLRQMPVVLDGVSEAGTGRILAVIREAEAAEPAAFRSSMYANGAFRKQLRVIAALLPVPDSDLPRAMWVLVGNHRAELSDLQDLLHDRVGEVPVSKVRTVIGLLRMGSSTSGVSDVTGVCLKKVSEVSAFLGCREARAESIEALAFEFASAEHGFQAFMRLNKHLPREDAREEYWKKLLAAHRSLTEFEVAALGIEPAHVKLADMCCLSPERARKYLAKARALVREVEPLPA